MLKAAAVFILLVSVFSGCASRSAMTGKAEKKLYFTSQTSEKKKAERRKEFANRHPEWTEEVSQAVLAGNVLEGMTTDQVLASYGKPLEILKTLEKSGRDHELWLYTTAYLTFDSDVMTGQEDVMKIETKYSLIEKARHIF